MERESRGPLAYFLKVKAFRSFLASYRKANYNAAMIQDSLRMGNKAVLDGPLPLALVEFNKKYGLLVETLIHVGDRVGRRVPFVNAFYFPRSTKDMKHFWDFVDAVGEAYNFERGETSGRPPGASKYRQADLIRYNKNKKTHPAFRAMELAFPNAFKNDSDGDPNKRLKPALSRLRKKKKERAPKRAPLFRPD